MTAALVGVEGQLAGQRFPIGDRPLGLGRAPENDVVVTDPAAVENARRLWPELQYATSVEEACAKADAVLVLTEWAEYRALDPVELATIVRRRHVLDGRNALDPARWKAAGWTYRALGRPRA
jgi:UDPglucose 6-dehydrogenase